MYRRPWNERTFSFDEKLPAQQPLLFLFSLFDVCIIIVWLIIVFVWFIIVVVIIIIIIIIWCFIIYYDYVCLIVSCICHFFRTEDATVAAGAKTASAFYDWDGGAEIVPM